VRRYLAGTLALVLLAVAVAGCGGGSSSTRSSSTTAESTGGGSASPAEAAWAREVEAVMTEFENDVSAQVMPEIDAADSQLLLEPLYRTYGLDLGTLAKKLEGTDAPAACVALRDALVGNARKLSAVTESLGHAEDLEEEEFGELLRARGKKLSRHGGRLTELSADLHC
jgi:hypothetical protein